MSEHDERQRKAARLAALQSRGTDCGFCWSGGLPPLNVPGWRVAMLDGVRHIEIDGALRCEGGAKK